MVLTSSKPLLKNTKREGRQQRSVADQPQDEGAQAKHAHSHSYLTKNSTSAQKQWNFVYPQHPHAVLEATPDWKLVESKSTSHPQYCTCSSMRRTEWPVKDFGAFGTEC